MKTCNLSGFGGSYEWGCQRMLQLGIAWLDAHPEFVFGGHYKGFRNVYGVCIAQTPEAEALDKAITADPKLKENGVTGAMHQCVIGHLVQIRKLGHEGWLSALAEAREPSEFFEFDGTEASIPFPEKTFSGSTPLSDLIAKVAEALTTPHGKDEDAGEPADKEPQPQ